MAKNQSAAANSKRSIAEKAKGENIGNSGEQHQHEIWQQTAKIIKTSMLSWRICKLAAMVSTGETSAYQRKRSSAA